LPSNRPSPAWDNGRNENVPLVYADSSVRAALTSGESRTALPTNTASTFPRHAAYSSAVLISSRTITVFCGGTPAPSPARDGRSSAPGGGAGPRVNAPAARARPGAARGCTATTGVMWVELAVLIKFASMAASTAPAWRRTASAPWSRAWWIWAGCRIKSSCKTGADTAAEITFRSSSDVPNTVGSVYTATAPTSASSHSCARAIRSRSFHQRPVCGSARFSAAMNARPCLWVVTYWAKSRMLGVTSLSRAPASWRSCARLAARSNSQFIFSLLLPLSAPRAEYTTVVEQGAGAHQFPSPSMGEGQGEGVAPQGGPLPLAPSRQGREEKQLSFPRATPTVVQQGPQRAVQT